MTEIKQVDLSKTDLLAYSKHLADCIILTHDNRLYLQRRPENWRANPGAVCLFGGHVEDGETPVQGVVREIEEETGGRINPQELVSVGAITEGFTNHTELVYVYFWHDKNNTITGCYEAEPIYFDTIEQALAHPKMMDYVKWALEECQQRGLIKLNPQERNLQSVAHPHNMSRR